MGDLMKYYILRSADSPWGDYGDILIHGMSNYVLRLNGKIQLYRTGPFIPPISFPGINVVVITDNLKKNLQRIWNDLVFLPVNKAHIVKLNWEDWDKSAKDPPFYPANGEPEGYILNAPHDPSSAAIMGDLWEMVIPESTDLSKQLDWFRKPSTTGVFVSEKTKKILETQVKLWVKFQRLSLDN